MFEDGLETEKFPESVWVAMSIGYSRNGCSKDVLVLYCGMLCRFVRLGNFPLSIALKSCTKLYELRVGRVIHGEDPDQVVYNALLRLYAECGCFKDVLRVFDEMPERDTAHCC